jgi:hypothetical protein
MAFKSFLQTVKKNGRLIGGILFLVGIILLFNSYSGITGNIVSEKRGKTAL